MLELSESLPVGTAVTSIVATDEDFGTNGQVNYAIASQYSSANDIIFNSKDQHLLATIIGIILRERTFANIFMDCSASVSIR